MSLPSLSGWQHCGEGFIGVPKLKHLVSEVGDSTLVRNKKKNNSDLKIVTEITPNGKGKDKRCRKPDASSVITLNPNRGTGLANTSWKQGEFLNEFSINIGKSSQNSDDINWSSSSSDEPMPNRTGTGSLKKACKNVPPRKRRRRSPSISSNALLHPKLASNRQQLCVVSNPSGLKSSGLSRFSESCSNHELLNQCNEEGENNGTDSRVVTESDNSTFNNNLQHCMPVQTQKIQQKPNDISWTLPSFDDCGKVTTVGSVPKEAVSVVDNFTLKGARSSSLPNQGRCLKSRVVRRLCVGESAEYLGQISDVESDADEVDIDTSDDEDGEKLLKVKQDVARPLDQQEEQEKGSQIEISSGTTSGSSAQSERMRASDWIKVLQNQKTPVKVDLERSSQEDSSKKKTKFARGSMADQLSRLINREKASVRFWYHSVRGGTFDENSNKCLVLKLLSLEKQFSVVMSRCHLMDESAGAKLCKAVFMCETAAKLGLKPGMTVQVFAPWHQLEESNGTRTILCTHFVKVLSSLGVGPSSSTDSKNEGRRLSASACWSCPCSKALRVLYNSLLDKITLNTDSHLPSRSCPAATCPVVTDQFLQMLACPESSILPRAQLQTVNAVSHHACESALLRRTILESFEAMRGVDSLLPTFWATVLRVFRNRIKGTLKQRLQLLVEDSAGTLAIVKLSDEFAAVPTSVWGVGGKSCSFSSLRVASRTNRDKEPALFGIVDQVWRQQLQKVSSQQSETEASQLQLRTAAPSFAYVLHSTSGVTCSSSAEQDETSKEVLNLMTLKQVMQSESETRVSFIARVMLPPRFSQTSGSAAVYVYDSSPDTEGSTVVQRVAVGSECVMEDSANAVYLFRDVLVTGGQWQCDSHTVVLDMPAWAMWGVHNRLDSSVVASVVSEPVKLAHVCDLSEPGHFVSLAGSVCGVDEYLSYSWDECEACGSDRLATSEEIGTTYCTGCNRQVASPVFRMKMEVYVTCSSPSQLTVKVDLTQKTIEALLPADPSEEGYDTHLVVGKSVKCPACLVQSRVPDPQSTDANGGSPNTILLLTELQW